MRPFRRLARAISTPPAWALILMFPIALALAPLFLDHDAVLTAYTLLVAIAPFPAALAVILLVTTYLSDPKRPRSWFLGAVAVASVASFAGTVLFSWLAWRRILPGWGPLDETDALLVLAEGIVLTSIGPILLAAAVLNRLSDDEVLPDDEEDA